MNQEFYTQLSEKPEACTQTRVYFDSISQKEGIALRRRKPQKPTEVCRVHATGQYLHFCLFCAIIAFVEFKDANIYISLCSNGIFIFQIASDTKQNSYTPITTYCKFMSV